MICFLFRYGTPRTAHLCQAWSAYRLALSTDPRVPPPLPPHAPSASTQLADSSSSPIHSGSSMDDGRGHATDLQYELLQLHCTATAGGAGSSSRHAPGADAIAQLLRVGGYSPCPLDYSFAWLLHSVLQGLGVLPVGRAAGKGGMLLGAKWGLGWGLGSWGVVKLRLMGSWESSEKICVDGLEGTGMEWALPAWSYAHIAWEGFI